MQQDLIFLRICNDQELYLFPSWGTHINIDIDIDIIGNPKARVKMWNQYHEEWV